MRHSIKTETHLVYSAVCVTIVFLFGNVLLYYPTTAHALTCVPTIGAAAIVEYSQGVYVRGFALDYVDTGRPCDSRLVVNDNIAPNVLSEITLLGRHSQNPDAITGIYEVWTYCIEEPGGCRGDDSPLVLLSSDPSQFENIRSDYEKMERKEYIWDIRVKWFPALLSFLTLLTVILPWLVLFLRGNFVHRRTLILSALILKSALFAATLSILSGLDLRWWSQTTPHA